MRKFLCSMCDTYYSTEGDEIPPTPKWDDGHECSLIEVNPYKRNKVFRRKLQF